LLAQAGGTTIQLSTRDIGPRSNSKNLQGGLETKNKWVPYSPCHKNLARNGVNRCGPFVTLANMPGSLNQFVLVSARKSRGGEWWSLYFL
jgi:hypothetical protein